MVYVPRDSELTVRSRDGGRFALASARCDRRLEARYRAAEDVPVEIRGAGSCSRQVNNFCSADSFEADRLIAVEVLTPAGNWSSYPPHKHDEDRPGEESVLEEIYYFEVADGPAGPGLGYHRVYGTAERPIDVTAEVRTGDVVLVPHGWHGPSMAAPGYHLYYLNVMAGPSADRAWLICDDPAHTWVRDTWADQDPDPRLPLTSPTTTPQEGRRMSTVRLTVAQATVRFLAQQWSERDGVEQRLIEGCFGIFGHGNVAGVGQALLEAETEDPHVLPYYLARNEQGMVHASAAFARMRNRLATLACTASIGPGSTNMVTGAALATINRLPVLLLPSDIFATRVSSPVLQELEDPAGLRRDRQRRVPSGVPVLRPGVAARAAAGGPARRDAGAHRPRRDRRRHDLPAAGRAGRGARLARGAVRQAGLARGPAGARARRAGPGRSTSSGRPGVRCVVAGGGVGYSEATDALRAFAEATGIPVGGDPGGQGLAALRPPAVRSAPSAAPVRRPPTRSPARPTS